MKTIALSIVGLVYRLGEIMRPAHVVVYYAWPDFARKANGIADVLRRKGFRVRVRSGNSLLNRVQVKFSKDLYIGFWNEYYFGYLPARYIFFNAEPLSAPKWRDDRGWFNAMRNSLEVWGYNSYHEKYISPLGVPFYPVPFGYAPYYESSFLAHTKGKPLTQDIDVFFAGQLSDRRQKVVDQMRALGIKVHTVSLRSPVYGEALDELLARSKIVLSMFNLEDPETHNADFARLDHLLSNRRFVIHETLSELAPDSEFEQHVITCAYEAIPATCLYYLQRPEDRARIAERAHQWFKVARALDDSIPYDHIRRYLGER